MLEEIIPDNESFHDFEVKHVFPEIGERVMMLNARRIPRPPEKARVILLAAEDITARRMIQGIHEKLLGLEIRMKASLGEELKIVGLSEKIREMREDLDRVRIL